jgi:uncharacterized protein (DUF1330 family)
MNKALLLASGAVLGGIFSAGVGLVNAQMPAAPAAANTTRPAVFYISEQTFVDEKKYNEEFVPKVQPLIKAHGGRFIARANEVTAFSGDAPKRVVITGFESLDDVKKWQESPEYKALIPIRDASIKVRSYAIPTCENPQGAKPGQTKCPN